MQKPERIQFEEYTREMGTALAELMHDKRKAQATQLRSLAVGKVRNQNIYGTNHILSLWTRPV